MSRYVDIESEFLKEWLRTETKKAMQHTEDLIEGKYLVYSPEGLNVLINEILGLIPTADVVERKHGEWAKEGYCPFCKCDMPAFIEDWEWKRCQTPYCPNCGAKMLD